MTHHRRGLRRLLKDDELLHRIESEGYERAGLDERRLAMLRYAEKLTLEPAKMRRSDVDALRDAGLSDVDVLQLCELVGYYAFANRIADGLGIELETWGRDDAGHEPGVDGAGGVPAPGGENAAERDPSSREPRGDA